MKRADGVLATVGIEADLSGVNDSPPSSAPATAKAPAPASAPPATSAVAASSATAAAADASNQ
jgi:hypothetical protein